jgi:hypothetical protein
MLAGDPTVSILGIADVNPWAPGIELARRIDVPVATDFRELVSDPRVDLVIDATGSGEVHKAIHAYKCIFITRFAAHAGMYTAWNALEDRAKHQEQAQWTLEQLTAGHPTESHHVMTRVERFKAIEQRCIPGTDERYRASDGFGGRAARALTSDR